MPLQVVKYGDYQIRPLPKSKAVITLTVTTVALAALAGTLACAAQGMIPGFQPQSLSLYLITTVPAVGGTELLIMIVALTRIYSSTLEARKEGKRVIKCHPSDFPKIVGNEKLPQELRAALTLYLLNNHGLSTKEQWNVIKKSSNAIEALYNAGKLNGLTDILGRKLNGWTIAFHLFQIGTGFCSKMLTTAEKQVLRLHSPISSPLLKIEVIEEDEGIGRASSLLEEKPLPSIFVQEDRDRALLPLFYVSTQEMLTARIRINLAQRKERLHTLMTEATKHEKGAAFAFDVHESVARELTPTHYVFSHTQLGALTVVTDILTTLDDPSIHRSLNPKLGRPFKRWRLRGALSKEESDPNKLVQCIEYEQHDLNFAYCLISADGELRSKHEIGARDWLNRSQSMSDYSSMYLIQDYLDHNSPLIAAWKAYLEEIDNLKRYHLIAIPKIHNVNQYVFPLHSSPHRKCKSRNWVKTPEHQQDLSKPTVADRCNHKKCYSDKLHYRLLSGRIDAMAGVKTYSFKTLEGQKGVEKLEEHQKALEAWTRAFKRTAMLHKGAPEKFVIDILRRVPFFSHDKFDGMIPNREELIKEMKKLLESKQGVLEEHREAIISKMSEFPEKVQQFLWSLT